jgi:hypothetical protein
MIPPAAAAPIVTDVMADLRDPAVSAASRPDQALNAIHVTCYV